MTKPMTFDVRCRNVAQVICKELGYSIGAIDRVPDQGRREKARQYRSIETVSCGGNEERLADCQREEWKDGDCDWNEVPWVFCRNNDEIKPVF